MHALRPWVGLLGFGRLDSISRSSSGPGELASCRGTLAGEGSGSFWGRRGALGAAAAELVPVDAMRPRRLGAVAPVFVAEPGRSNPGMLRAKAPVGI